MFTMKAFKYVIQFWFSVLMIIVVVPAFSYIHTGRVPFPGILREMLIGFIVGNTVGLLLPIQPFAEKFAGLFRAKVGTFVYSLLTSFVFVSFYVVVFGFLFTALAIGFPPYYFRAVLNGIPLSFVVCYIAAIAINPVALRLSLWTCSKKT